MLRFFYLIGMLICSSAFAEDFSFNLPTCPPTQVCDEHHLLPEKERTTYETELSSLLENDGINLKLIVLPSLFNTPPDFVARQIGESWGSKELQGVIVYVPKQTNTPAFWMGGTITTEFDQDPRIKNGLLLRMQKRVSGEITEHDKVHAAISELSDALRFLKASWREYKVIYDAGRKEAYHKWAEDRQRKRTREIILYSLVGLSLLTLPLLFFLWKNRTQVCYFPATSARRRFGAPYAGGNSVSIKLITR